MTTATIETSAPPQIHIKAWSGARNVRITDMANAGKIGKRCRILSVGVGCYADPGAPLYDMAANLDPATNFDDAYNLIWWACVDMGHDPARNLDEREIKGIDAPRTVLHAGIPGKWSGSADEDGIHLRDDADPNVWTEITHRQTGPRAYVLAAKVWDRVQACATVYEAARVLTDAGCVLHGYCAMD